MYQKAKLSQDSRDGQLASAYEELERDLQVCKSLAENIFYSLLNWLGAIVLQCLSIKKKAQGNLQHNQNIKPCQELEI